MRVDKLQRACIAAAFFIAWPLGLLAAPAAAAERTPLQQEVADLLKAGYPPSVIYYHTVSKGARIYEAVNAAILADPAREAEFRDVGINLISYLPSAACGPYGYQVSTSPRLQRRDYEYDDLEQKTVEEVAGRFFEKGERLTRLVDGAHGMFPVKELADLAAQGGNWYSILPVRGHPVQDGVFVSLYRNGRQVVVDANLDRVRQAQEAGLTTMPVIFQYVYENEVPISRLCCPATGKEVVDKYHSDTIRVTSGPNWKNGDYVANYGIGDLEEVVDIPAREDIDDELWQRIEADLEQNGFSYPVMVRISSTRVELFNSPERVAVAKARGESEVPATFIYEPGPNVNIPAPCSVIVAGSPGGPPPPPPPKPTPTPTPKPRPPISE